MNDIAKLAVVAIVSTALIGCTTVRPLADNPAASARVLHAADAPFAPREWLRITTDDGRQQEIRYLSRDDTSISGMIDGTDRIAAVSIDRIQRIERREVDNGKVARNAILLIVSGVIVVHAMASAAAGALVAQ
jgi:hypothetical protein